MQGNQFTGLISDPASMHRTMLENEDKTNNSCVLRQKKKEF